MANATIPHLAPDIDDTQGLLAESYSQIEALFKAIEQAAEDPIQVAKLAEIGGYMAQEGIHHATCSLGELREKVMPTH